MVSYHTYQEAKWVIYYLLMMWTLPLNLNSWLIWLLMLCYMVSLPPVPSVLVPYQSRMRGMFAMVMWMNGVSVPPKPHPATKKPNLPPSLKRGFGVRVLIPVERVFHNPSSPPSSSSKKDPDILFLLSGSWESKDESPSIPSSNKDSEGWKWYVLELLGGKLVELLLIEEDILEEEFA